MSRSAHSRPDASRGDGVFPFRPSAAASREGKLAAERPMYSDADLRRISESVGGSAGDSTSTGLANSMWAVGIAKTGLIGLVIGALFGAAQHEGSKRGVLYELTPQPEAFDLDSTLGVLFNRLAKYRHLQESAYEMALRWSDQLLLREREISRTRRSSDGEYGLAQTFFFAVISQLCALRNRAKDGQTRAQIQILKNEIVDCLKHHLLLIRHMSAGTRV